MRALAFIASTLLQLGMATVAFFFLLLALNGYSESDAKPGLTFYVLIGAGSSLLVGGLSWYMSKRFATRNGVRPVLASTIGVALSFVVGVVLLIGAFFGAIIISEVMRGR